MGEGVLGQQRKTVEAERQCAKDRKEWRAAMKLNEFHAAIFACPVFFRTALTCSGGYQKEGAVA